MKQLSSPHLGREAGQPGVQGQCWLHGKFKASLGCLRQCLKGRKTKGALILVTYAFLSWMKKQVEENSISYCPIICLFFFVMASFYILSPFSTSVIIPQTGWYIMKINLYHTVRQLKGPRPRCRHLSRIFFLSTARWRVSPDENQDNR